MNVYPNDEHDYPQSNPDFSLGGLFWLQLRRFELQIEEWFLLLDFRRGLGFGNFRFATTTVGFCLFEGCVLALQFFEFVLDHFC